MLHFRVKLFFIMIIFATILAFTIATIDHLRLKEQAIEHNQIQMKHIEETVEASLHAIEKAYFFFDKETAAKMEQNTHYLLNLYENNPSFEEWNFDTLKNLLGMDIYIIDEQNTITYSSFKDDIGLNFSKCCQKLARVLDERRRAGVFFEDGLDIEQETGIVKKYSYMATKDKKYIIELGFSLQNGPIFKEFNFFHVIDGLVENYPQINSINVLNIGGYPLGDPITATKLSKEQRQAFEKTLATRKTTELDSTWENEDATFRYVHYNSTYDFGTTKDKILEIVYNDRELQQILKKNKKVFAIELFVVLLTTIIAASIISKLVAKPMYLAFHDSLTGLKNRAAFTEQFNTRLPQDDSTAFLMIDLDNFKEVNDYLGHDEGDRLLKMIGQLIHSITAKKGEAFRLGGDEFVIIIPSTNREEVEELASTLIKLINERTSPKYKQKGIQVTASIGIALSPEHGVDPNLLYKKADVALYTSKEKGKSQYHLYTNEQIENTQTKAH